MRILTALLLSSATVFAANTPPTPQIISANMRAGTTLMDVVYQVNDPDDATVRVRALAFVNGTRSFANVLKPVTFVNDTASNLGDAIPANTTQVLTWDVGADWNIDLGQVKFEILALDSRGLLPFDWITIPAAQGQPALTISKDTPSDAATLNALFWLYADGDPGLTLSNGVLTGTTQSGVFHGVQLAKGSSVSNYGPPFCFKKMNLDPANGVETTYGNSTARAGLLNPSNWHALNAPFGQLSILMIWGQNSHGQAILPVSTVGIVSAAGGWGQSLGRKDNGTVVGWGNNNSGQITPPAGLSGVVQISKGHDHSLALKSDGTVVAWGNISTALTIPAGLSNVTQISAGSFHNLALRGDGTVVAWGDNGSGRSTVPAGLTGVKSVAAGSAHSMALKLDGTLVLWGDNGSGRSTVPPGLAGVSAIAGGGAHSLALKSDGTVAAWGDNSKGQCTIPAGLNGVTAIAAGVNHSLALKSDGTVVAWGSNEFGQCTIPEGVSGVVFIAAGQYHSFAIKSTIP